MMKAQLQVSILVDGIDWVRATAEIVGDRATIDRVNWGTLGVNTVHEAMTNLDYQIWCESQPPDDEDEKE